MIRIGGVLVGFPWPCAFWLPNGGEASGTLTGGQCPVQGWNRARGWPGDRDPARGDPLTERGVHPHQPGGRRPLDVTTGITDRPVVMTGTSRVLSPRT